MTLEERTERLQDSLGMIGVPFVQMDFSSACELLGYDSDTDTNTNVVGEVESIHGVSLYILKDDTLLIIDGIDGNGLQFKLAPVGLKLIKH